MGVQETSATAPSVVTPNRVVQRKPIFDEPDADLAIRARDGESDAYRKLVERYQTLAFRTAYLVTRSAADAQDAAQDGFVKAYLALETFEPGGAFRPWLLAIVANEAKNRVRGERRRLVYERSSGDFSAQHQEIHGPERVAIASDESNQLINAVNELPEEERLIVGLRYFLELSEAETAAAAGVPRGTVKSRLSRALGRLREMTGGIDA